jgi:PhnB protein
MTTNAMPKGYHTLQPSLMVHDAARAIEFYKNAFGARENLRFPMPDGKIAYAELEVGDSRLILADADPAMDAQTGKSAREVPLSLTLYVDDVDTVFEKAKAAGATVEEPLKNQFYGDRQAAIIDPVGQRWFLATRVEDVSKEELERRMSSMAAPA